jgi:tellurite resistance protein TerC
MVILAIGSVVLAVGLAMTVLPGPAVLVIPAGLAILASEFRWARRLLVRMRQTARRASRRLFGRRRKGAGVG